MVEMSLRCGRLESCSGPAVSRLAQRMGSAAFLAPEMATSPASGVPPLMISLSTSAAPVFRGPFLGREGLHRQRVQFAAVEMRLQHRIDALLALHAVLAGEFGADDGRPEV